MTAIDLIENYHSQIGNVPQLIFFGLNNSQQFSMLSSQLDIISKDTK